MDAFLLAASHDDAIGRVMNLGSTEIVGLKDLAATIVKIHGQGNWELVPFPPDRKAIDIGDYYGDFALANAVLGWRPEVELHEGLRRTLEYYRVHGDRYWEA